MSKSRQLFHRIRHPISNLSGCNTSPKNHSPSASASRSKPRLWMSSDDKHAGWSDLIGRIRFLLSLRAYRVRPGIKHGLFDSIGF